MTREEQIKALTIIKKQALENEDIAVAEKATELLDLLEKHENISEE